MLVPLITLLFSVMFHIYKGYIWLVALVAITSYTIRQYEDTQSNLFVSVISRTIVTAI